MKELLEVIAKRLVENPEQVSVTETENDRTLVLELSGSGGYGQGHRQAGKDCESDSDCCEGGRRP